MDHEGGVANSVELNWGAMGPCFRMAAVPNRRKWSRVCARVGCSSSIMESLKSKEHL